MANITGLLFKYKKVPDERFFSEIFNDAEYRKARGRTDLVVIDAGALAGEFCAYIYDQTEIIYALEPHPAHYGELVSNIKKFGLKKVKPFNIALSNKNGTGFLGIKPERGANALTEKEGPIVETKTLATFMAGWGIEHVDVLKIDIEGGEDAVFESDDFAQVADKIDMIIGEHLGASREKLKSLGFVHEEIDKNNIILRRKNEG